MSFNANIVNILNYNSIQSAVIPSTRARVLANITLHYSVGVKPTAYTGNCELIPAGVVRYINMEGTNNKLAFIASSTGVGEVSIVPCGTVLKSGTVTSSDTYIPT